MANTVDEVAVQFAARGQDQMAGAFEGAAKRSTVALEDMAVASEAVGRRVEHLGVSMSFAANALSEGSERGVTRAAHAFASLGFMLGGPWVGAITVALALAAERMIEFFHKTEDAAKKATEKVEASIEAMRRAGQGEALMREAKLAAGDVAELTGKQLDAAAAYNAAKKTIDDMHGSIARGSPIYKKAHNEEIARWNDLTKANAALHDGTLVLKKYQEGLLDLRNALPEKGILPVTSTAESDAGIAKMLKEWLKKNQEAQVHFTKDWEHTFQIWFDGQVKMAELGSKETLRIAEETAKKAAEQFKKLWEEAQRSMSEGSMPDEEDKRLEARAVRMQKTLADTFANGFKTMFSGGGIAGGLRSVGDQMLSELGKIFVDLGEKAVMGFWLIKVIMANLASWAPEGGLWAGLGLIALGEAMQMAGSSHAGGGGGFGGSVVSSGGGGGMGSVSVVGASRSMANSSPVDTSALRSVQPVTMHNTIIGINDPQAQRAILELQARASRRGSTSGN